MPTPKKPEAAETEATGRETISLTLSFDDIVEDFDLPASADDWPFSFNVAFDAGKLSEAMSALLGPEQFERFLKANPTNGKVKEFVNLYMEALGLNPGE